MLLYCMALPLQNEPKHSYVGLVVREIIDFLSRTVEFWDIAHYSQPSWWWRATQNATFPRQSWSDTEPVCAATPVCIAYYMSETSEGISLDNLVRKKQYITPLPHPLPSLQWVAARSNMTAGSNVKVLKLYKL